MSRRTTVTILLPQPDPEPTYPEYEELRRAARAKDGGPISGRTIATMEDVVARRGADWCTAVLGRSFPGLGRVPSRDGWMLILADERGLDPALPDRIVQERRAAEALREERAAAAAARREQENRRWALITAAAPAAFAVRENTRHSGVRGPLGHVTAAVDLVSGRSRQHKAGMGLCERPGRTNPLHLGEPLEGTPPTCVRCIEYAGQVRTLDAPAPPTPAEAALLLLIRDGVVFTMSPGRGQPTVRDTSTRSHDVAWGQLGRKVDGAARKLEAKGWTRIEDDWTSTPLGGTGRRWRLTDAGSAALEG
ncbi:hypothetical protein HHL19_35600 [Streptomyces sp. R302]|uniref:hypothetical protein n=1 Tax=unclassified Streptomyces TaxID=2593676 RepID=UPI00145D42B6|nr:MULTISPECIES: hypothetical protein [unclassified Streptomyces]NML55134.1 hypothetical protein [Streptomyces sp. R301]NML83836.1 hypothetical protein [Streptomyces sp. R302]